MSHRQSVNPSKVIYDLDGVVTRKDTFTWLLVQRLRSSPPRLLRATPAIWAWVRSAAPERRAHEARRIATIALAGMSDDAYSTLARDSGARWSASPAWIRTCVVDRMRQQHAEGRTIIVATASEERLAEELLRTAGAPFDHLSASQLAPTPTGPEITDHRVGERKAEALTQAGVDIEKAEFVTDSATDLPTARRAASVILVAPSRRTLEQFATAGVTASVLSPPAEDT